jgi:WXG100 family type VII secretion target
MEINVNYGSLDHGSQQIGTVTRNLVNRLDALQSALRTVSAGWSGEAERAFNVNMRTFNTELDKLRAVQAAAGAAVANTRVQYQATDRRNAARQQGV